MHGDKNEFYIGWMPKAPVSFAKNNRRFVLVLLTGIIAVGLLAAIAQKKFGTGNFEFGILTEVKGVYFNRPVPNIKVVNGKDIFGRFSYVTIPLVGFSKHGVDVVIEDIEKEKKVSLNQKEITLKGVLLYNDGKLLMQIDSNDKPVTSIGGEATNTLLPVLQQLGEQTIRGEIIDPKCYFGVMKPGEGKPHKDCATRCILGGISPVFRVTNENGESNYYLIVGANGEKINEAVKDFVAEPVSLTASVVKYDDWIVLYIQNKGINRIAGAALAKPDAVAIACSNMK